MKGKDKGKYVPGLYLSTTPWSRKRNRKFNKIMEHNGISLPKGYHLEVVEGPSTPHDPESDAGGILSSWQGHPSR
jgi:hypothetical protein